MNIIKSIEEIFFANGRYWGGLNFSLYNSGSVWAMNTGIESADLNMAWNEKPLTVGDCKTIQDVKKHFQRAGLPFWWWVFPDAQSQITGKMLSAEGFSFVESIPSMLADLTALSDDRRNTGLQIIQISNKEELFLWEEVSFAGFHFPPETRQQYHRFVGTFNLSPGSPQKFFLACLNGKPVATSLLFLHENAGGIYFVCTLAEFRRKGIGLALNLATMRFAKQAGARFATLQSSPDGLRVYQQAGFKEYCRVDVYSLAPL
ncbi:MAG: GNAT family N-acetyltransferase [Smithellaceae bacterium]